MKITDTVYALDATRGAYVYLITGEENILIDTGLPFKGKALLRELRSLGVDPASIAHILLTHHDIDHVGNAAMLEELTGATLWASEKDRLVILGQAERHGFKKYLKHIFRVKKPKKITVYVPGEEINGIAVIPTPGHTEGHVCFLYDGVLFAGDLLENKKETLIPYPAGWNWNNDRLRDSVKEISGLAFTWVCPAHGEPIKRGTQLPPT